MGIFSFFRSRPKSSAATAKERLQVLIAHQHSDNEGPDYLPLLKQDILNVIKKYVDIGEEQVLVQLDSQDDCDVLELNITLPEENADTHAASTASEAKRRAGKSAAASKPRAAAGKQSSSSNKSTQKRKSARNSSSNHKAGSGKGKQRKKRESVSN